MIDSQIKLLAQATSYLGSVTSVQYNQIVSPLFISSSGAHMRHILDHYKAIMVGMEIGFIDYDKRSRGGKVETDIEQALALIAQIDEFLLSLTKTQLQQSVKLSTEVSVDCKQVEIVNSTLARELVFVGSHAIHHFAMIDQISKAQNITAPKQFGIAPATSTFLRDTENKKVSNSKCAH